MAGWSICTWGCNRVPTYCLELVSVYGPRCRECGVFRCSLRQKYSRWYQSLQKMSKFANNRILTTPRRRKKLVAHKKKLAARKISRMTSAIHKLISKEGVTLETDMHSDFCEVTKEQLRRGLAWDLPLDLDFLR